MNDQEHNETYAYIWGYMSATIEILDDIEFDEWIYKINGEINSTGDFTLEHYELQNLIKHYGHECFTQKINEIKYVVIDEKSQLYDTSHHALFIQNNTIKIITLQEFLSCEEK